MNHPELHHWQTSKINFGSEQAANSCLAELERHSKQKIMMHGKGAEVMFEGYFDVELFEKTPEMIVAEFCQVPCEYAVKTIFNEPDGFFGGWTVVLNNKGETLKSYSLTEVFKGFF